MGNTPDEQLESIITFIEDNAPDVYGLLMDRPKLRQDLRERLSNVRAEDGTHGHRASMSRRRMVDAYYTRLLLRLHHDPLVIRFRERHGLSSCRGELRDIVLWLRQARQEDALLDGARRTRRMVCYRRPIGPAFVRIYDRGKSHELADLIAEIVDAYGCTASEATAAVFGKKHLDARPLAVAIEYVHELPAMSRIVIRAHPSTSADTVAVAYGAVRKRMGISDRRPISDKSAALALFALKHLRSDSKRTPWKEMRQAFNAEYGTMSSEMPYSGSSSRRSWAFPETADISNFRKAVLHSLKMLAKEVVISRRQVIRGNTISLMVGVGKQKRRKEGA